MSTELEIVGRLVGATAIADAAREAADRLADYRDDLLRQARLEGIPAARIASLTGLSRPRVYQIINAPHPDDASANEDLAEQMSALWHIAENEWESQGYQGRVEDYFPLGEAMDVAR
jgi:hypothetical protein